MQLLEVERRCTVTVLNYQPGEITEQTYSLSCIIFSFFDKNNEMLTFHANQVFKFTKKNDLQVILYIYILFDCFLLGIYKNEL